ncbi:MAG: serine hydroxymethyltransferase, partial [Glutamicibacter protophormiae]
MSNKTYESLAPASLTQSLAELDPEVAARIDAELARQQRGLEMIASENHTAQAVM